MASACGKTPATMMASANVFDLACSLGFRRQGATTIGKSTIFINFIREIRTCNTFNLKGFAL